MTRSLLTGDWDGVRDDLETRGVTLDMTLTQIQRGVLSGGTDHVWQYGGCGNLTVNLDTQKLGLWPGGFASLEVEDNFGIGINLDTGAIVPVNTNQCFPDVGGDNFNVPLLSFTQFVSPYFGVFAGKLDTLSSDDRTNFKGATLRLMASVTAREIKHGREAASLTRVDPGEIHAKGNTPSGSAPECIPLSICSSLGFL